MAPMAQLEPAAMHVVQPLIRSGLLACMLVAAVAGFSADVSARMGSAACLHYFEPIDEPLEQWQNTSQ